MWRLFLAIGLFIGTGAGPVAAQQWSGTAALDLSGGYQTNLYLDPVLGTWNADVTPALGALTPRVGLTRTTSRTRLDLTVQSRLHPRRSEGPQLTQGTIRFRYRLAPEWTLGVSGGGTRYRFPPTRDVQGDADTISEVTTERDSWWALPSLRWAPASNTMVTLRGGITQRFERSFEPTDRQTSGLVSLRATHWFTDRLRGGTRFYFSGGRTSEADVGFGGTGGHLTATYWPTGAVSVQGKIGGEQVRYETLQSPDETARDQIGQAGLEVEWSLRSSITLFGRAKGLYADLDESPSGTADLHVSGGVRLQVQRDLGGTSDPSPQRRVCRSTDEGLQIRVPYEGNGTLHVTGDFNG